MFIEIYPTSKAASTCIKRKMGVNNHLLNPYLWWEVPTLRDPFRQFFHCSLNLPDRLSTFRNFKVRSTKNKNKPKRRIDVHWCLVSKNYIDYCILYRWCWCLHYFALILVHHTFNISGQFNTISPIRYKKGKPYTNQTLWVFRHLTSSHTWMIPGISKCLAWHVNPIWVFPKIVVPQNGWFIMVPNPIKMGWFGGFSHYFWVDTHMPYYKGMG